MEISRRDTINLKTLETAAPLPAASDFHRPRGRVRMIKSQAAKYVLFAASVLLILLLVAIAGVLVYEALPILRQNSLVDILTSQAWHPTQLAFGLLHFIAGSFIVTVFAMLLGVGRMRLLSHPRKMPSMTGFDLEVAGFESDTQE